MYRSLIDLRKTGNELLVRESCKLTEGALAVTDVEQHTPLLAISHRKSVQKKERGRFWTDRKRRRIDRQRTTQAIRGQLRSNMGSVRGRSPSQRRHIGRQRRPPARQAASQRAQRRLVASVNTSNLSKLTQNSRAKTLIACEVAS
jgi:hypothetical protein